MQSGDWNPNDARSWSRALGLVYVPMFPDALAKNEPGNHAVLMDGKASFTLSICDDADQLKDRPVSWSWSSDVNHAIVVDSKREEFFVRRWDYPVARRFRLPENVGQAGKVVHILNQSGTLRAPDVVSHVLRAFRQVRAALHGQKTIEAVKVFLALLVAAERKKAGVLETSDVINARTVADVLSLLQDTGGTLDAIYQIEQRAKRAQIGTLLSDFSRPQPLTGCILEPGLLLRHAAGRLFQEANLVVERENFEQLHLAGLAPDAKSAGRLERDVRFTPPTLARTLAERSLNALPRIPKKLCAFDPACGSGVFLQEVLRELQSRDFDGEVTLKGFDISEVSCLLANFCLYRAASENKSNKARVKVEISQQDALKSDWPDFDVALMNPPFVPYERMDAENKKLVREQLGELAEGRPDKAMVFVWKAVQQIKRGKAIGAVIPAPLLETQSGESWRNAIAEKTDIRLLGKFHGFGYFAASQVEPGFLVFGARGTNPTSNVKVVLAKGGFEDESLRALRLGVETTANAVEGWEIYSASSQLFTPGNWMPRSQADLELLDGLNSGTLSRIGELFDVKQGIRSGCDACFIISQDEFESLKAKEKIYFRASATNATIREGRIFPGEWIFYPYDKSGSLINDEAELKNKVPSFYEAKLKPAKSKLQKRAKTDPNKWWLLTWERGWQREKCSKIVSASFGGRGRFACDKSGTFVIVQGHGWLWRKCIAEAEEDTSTPNDWFFSTDLPFVYLAIFNSGVFERLLALFCPRVQDGQFDLSNRFVDKVPLPDLSQTGMVDADVCASLVEMGRRIHAGRIIEVDHLENLVARIYRIPIGAVK